MGLDTSHDCWHGAYSAFNRWREAVAKAAGIPLQLMEGFWGYGTVDEWRKEVMARNLPRTSAFAPDGGVMVATRETLTTALSELGTLGDAGTLASALQDIHRWLPIRWESLKPDPIHILLYHSDCDGEIAAEDCGPIADSLAALLPEIGKGMEPWGHIGGSWQEKTQEFIDGLRRAAAANEPVEFH